MLAWLRRRAQDRETAVDLYGAVVAEARRPVFFARTGVEDTPEGRAGLIILILFPVLERLQAGSPRARRAARFLTEAYVTDVDDCLREMGVGDMAVPKKVKRAAQALGERCLAYSSAATTAEPVSRLAAEIATTIPGLENAPVGSETLARFSIAIRDALQSVSEDALLAGRIAFPPMPDEPVSGEREDAADQQMETPR